MQAALVAERLEMREWRDILALFLTHAETMALATVVGTRGSSYRAAGARMLVTGEKLAGSISGGCLEDEIAECAREVIRSGTPILRSIDTQLRFGCSGAIDVFIERIRCDNPFLHAVNRAWTERRTLHALTPFRPGSRMNTRVVAEGTAPGEFEFVDAILPPIRLLVVGGGRDTEGLIQFAKLLGWETHVFERVTHADEVPAPDPRTAVVIKTRHFGRDLLAVQALLPLRFGYVGLVGAARRRDQMLATLADEGYVEAAASFPRLHAPAGIDLGSETPHEIALAIIAEIQAAISGYGAGFLRNKRSPIHFADPDLTCSELRV